MNVSVALEKDPGRRRGIVEHLTAQLPEWFGLPEANRHYAEQAECLDGWVAQRDGEAVGLLLLKCHSAVSAEIYWLGVDPRHHRQAIGRRMIEAIEHRLRNEKIKFLFVMTLHPEDPYEPYQRTRAFYEAMGFELVLSPAPAPESTSNRLACYLKVL